MGLPKVKELLMGSGRAGRAFVLAVIAAFLVALPVSAQTNTELVVAVGDSYVSGEGGVPYRVGSDTDANRCHRSISSPVTLLALAPGVSAQDVSCSGATTYNVVTAGRYDEAPQVDRIDTGAKRIVVSIGGNNIGFGAVLGCFLRSDCGQDKVSLQALAAIKELGPQLDETYDAIRSAAPKAKVSVLLYPRLLPPDGTTDLSRCSEISPGEVAAGNAIQTALNNKIAERAKAHGIDVIKPIGFDGHDVCSARSFFYRPGDARLVAIYHPNESGRLALAASIAVSN